MRAVSGGLQLLETPEVIQILAHAVATCPDIPVNNIQVPRAGTCMCSRPWQGARSAPALPAPLRAPLAQRVYTKENTLYREIWVRSPSQGCRGQCPAVQAPPAATVLATLCCPGGCPELPSPLLGQTSSRAILLQSQPPSALL